MVLHLMIPSKNSCKNPDKPTNVGQTQVAPQGTHWAQCMGRSNQKIIVGTKTDSEMWFRCSL